MAGSRIQKSRTPRRPPAAAPAELPARAAALRPIALANRHPRLRLDARAVRRALHTLEAAHRRVAPHHPRLAAGELSLVFLTDEALAQLHGQFLGDPSATDVITFAGDPAYRSAGEICVSADAPRRQRAADFSAELTLYLVHGWLHLVGYDDLQPEKKRAMRRAEARALRALRAADALPTFQPKNRR